MKVKVLLVMPGKEVQIMKIPASFKFIKSFIGEELYEVKLDKNIMILANKNASVDEFNRMLGDNIILGTFLIASIKNNRINSLKKKEQRKYANIFKLRKHKKKLDMYKNEFLEDFYTKQKEFKQINAGVDNVERVNMAA